MFVQIFISSPPAHVSAADSEHPITTNSKRHQEAQQHSQRQHQSNIQLKQNLKQNRLSTTTISNTMGRTGEIVGLL
jgi:hypothetical protein